MEEERDVVVFADDDGNEFELDVIDYFDYEDQEYAVLMDLSAMDAECEECGEEGDACDECDHQHEVYIMKIVVNGDMEEFLPPDEDKMDTLIAIVEKRMEECDDDCGCGCGDDCEDGCCDDDCDCCHHHE